MARNLVLKHTHPRHCSGQSLPEFLVVVPIFLFMVLMIFQLALIYRAKTTLDYATFEAARAGAVKHADLGEMRSGLARGLTPLYATSPDVAGLARARLMAEADLLLNSEIEIVSPTRQAWDDHNEPQYDGRRALPNDNLAFRSNDVRPSGVNVQDANILKINVAYDYPLIVPFVDLVLGGRSDYIAPDGMFDPGIVDLKPAIVSGPVLGNYRRMTLRSQAIVRMQSPIYEDNAASLR